MHSPCVLVLELACKVAADARVAMAAATVQRMPPSALDTAALGADVGPDYFNELTCGSCVRVDKSGYALQLLVSEFVFLLL